MPNAADVVNALDQQALASILKTYGEEKHAKKIASAIVQARSIYPITRTQQLASIVAGTLINSALCLKKKRKSILIPKVPEGSICPGNHSGFKPVCSFLMLSFVNF